MCKKNFACVCLATFCFLFYCVPHQERTRLQIYTQIYRIAFRKIKRPIFLSFLEPSDGSYNDDDQTIIAIQAGLKSVDRSMQYLRSWSNRHPGGRKKKGKWFVRPASHLHETSFSSLSYLRAQMHSLLSHRTRLTCYPFRQVINGPLLRKRIHLRIHLVSSSSPRRCILQQARDMQIVRFHFWSYDVKKSSVKFLRPSIDRAYLVVDRYVSPQCVPGSN